MVGIVDWATARARMIIALIVLSVGAGGFAYFNLPKEGSPDIDIPAVFVSVPFPGISAQDAEKLLIRPMETRLKGLEGLKHMTATAAEGYGGIALEFEFNWDKTATLANIRDKMNKAQSDFPEGAKQYSITEINFSQFPILVVALSGDLPERTLLKIAKDLQTDIESLPEILEAGLAGHRNEMLEVIIDPLKLESYNVTAGELIDVVTNNNQLIAAGEVETANGAFSVKIPASFDSAQDVYALPVKVNGDRVVTLGDLAEIRLTFEDLRGTARYNGRNTVALQIVKRKGANVIDTVAKVKDFVREREATWPQAMRDAVRLDFAMDMSTEVKSMVNQLEVSVLTAIALVMIVVLASLGTRSALLVGFAIPSSFLLCFALLAAMGVAISNMVMFGLILAVGMLVDGAIVVVEFADKRISEGVGPFHAYGEAAKRMFWPIVSSTATTLCAFLPMLLWPGVSGEFMGMLPVTLIFVLTASLVVALIFLPVVGGMAGRISRFYGRISAALAQRPVLLRLALFLGALGLTFFGGLRSINPLWPSTLGADVALKAMDYLPGVLMFTLGTMAVSVTRASLARKRKPRRIRAGYRRTTFGRFIALLTTNPVMPLVAIAAVAGFVMWIFTLYEENNKGVEFFVQTDPERAIAYVMARGNLSVQEKDALVRQAEQAIMQVDGVASIFSFAGSSGLTQFTGGATKPRDMIGQVQIELTPWDQRLGGPTGKQVLAEVERRLKEIPGIRSEILEQEMGPANGKDIQIRLKGDDWQDLLTAVATVRAKLEDTPALIRVDDTRPLPGIDWQVDVDVEAAGRYGANVATVGAMVQLVTRGLLLDTMRVPSSDQEIDIRVRVPEQDRLLATLDTLRVRTRDGLIPLSNFVTRKPVSKLAEINRIDGERYFDVVADVQPGLTLPDGTAITPTERIKTLTKWLQNDADLPAGISWEFAGNQDDQAESAAFLQYAFAGALGLMFVILLAQFNSFYNSVLVLLAVILSTTGVLIGMMVEGQTFSIIMTGTGVVALAGIVVNNNIVLIDTYQEFVRYMPRIEAIVRTAEARIRPVLLTTITTMAGLIPMMKGISLDFFNGGYTIDAPTALWWKQLAAAVVYGLGIATVLTLVLTPALLALRVWIEAGAYGSVRRLAALAGGPGSQAARDLALERAARRMGRPLLTWNDATFAGAGVGTGSGAEAVTETETVATPDAGAGGASDGDSGDAGEGAGDVEAEVVDLGKSNKSGTIQAAE